jgi:hypothetical protein
MTVAQIEPLSDEGGIDHTPKTSHPRASGNYMTATPFDLEVYADRYSEMLETQELEYQQSLEDAAEETDRHRDQPERNARILKLDWPIVHGGGDAA